MFRYLVRRVLYGVLILLGSIFSRSSSFLR